MNIGFLDRRIVFQSQSAAVDIYGDSTGVWVDSFTVWAALDNKSAGSTVIQEQENTINRVTWRVRSSAAIRLITPKWRIKYGSDFYNILAIQEVGRNNELHFVSERVISE